MLVSILGQSDTHIDIYTCSYLHWLVFILAWVGICTCTIYHEKKKIPKKNTSQIEIKEDLPKDEKIELFYQKRKWGEKNRGVSCQKRKV